MGTHESVDSMDCSSLTTVPVQEPVTLRGAKEAPLFSPTFWDVKVYILRYAGMGCTPTRYHSHSRRL